MNSIDYGKKLADEFGVNFEDARTAINMEAEDMRNDPFQGRKPRYVRSLEMAYEHVREWLRNGNEYVVPLDYAKLATFAMSHRKACVWAVLMAKGGRKRK